MWHPFKWLKSKRAADPVHSCGLYKTKTCAHVDGMLCDFPTCSMLAAWKQAKKKP